MVGRNEGKVRALHSRLKLDNKVGVLIADIEDQVSMDTVAKQTKVIISTAGPFALIGTPVIDACVRSGTHYCDITGEAPWVRSIIDKHHQQAEEKHLRIVNCCGFDCIPADLGTQMIVDEMKKLDVEPVEVRFICKDVKGGASGGTIASVMNIFATSTIAGLQASSNPYLLAPREDITNSPMQTTNNAIKNLNQDSFSLSYDSIVGKWMMPYVMQSIDTRVVHRSNALSNYGYGKDLIYREYQLAPNMLMAMLSTLLFPIGGMVLFFSLTRNFVHRFLPKQGEGPNQDMLDNGFFKILLWGRGKDKEGADVIVKGGIRALHGDPGYR